MKRIWLSIGMLILGTCSAQAAGSPAQENTAISCPADLNLARLAAASDSVLVGKMNLSRERILEESQNSSPDYFDIPIRIDRSLKGDDVPELTMRYLPRDAWYKPSLETILSLVGKPAIIFLTRVDEGPVGYYFAGSSPDALTPATENNSDSVRVEVARQSDILRSWRADTTLPLYSEVQLLIGRLGQVEDEAQQQVFEQLEALGKEAVPAIIAQMDDRRPLKTQYISLENHAEDKFEAARQYGPEQVVDGLDAILNQISGRSFGNIQNGGSDRERDAAVAGWRVYAADLHCQKISSPSAQ